jgi:hypothetical protein
VSVVQHWRSCLLTSHHRDIVFFYLYLYLYLYPLSQSYVSQPPPEILNSVADMAPTTYEPADITSPVTKVSAELLEKILSGAVSDVASPVIWHPNGYQIYLSQILKDLSGTPGFCSTFKAFRDMPWRASVKMIDESVYDVRSKSSMENFETISKSIQLAQKRF